MRRHWAKVLTALYIARRDDRPVAAILEATAPDGYSRAIQLLVGVDFTGTVLDTR